MPLSRGEVLGGALRLLDDVGFDALTMRRLADTLDVQAGAIYWHFANKQELIDAMTEQIMAGLLEPAPKGTWDRRLGELCRRLATALTSRRDGARLATNALKPGPNSLAISEAMMRIARGSGLSREATLSATAALGYFVLGYATDVQATETAKTRGNGTSALEAFEKQLGSSHISIPGAAAAHQRGARAVDERKGVSRALRSSRAQSDVGRADGASCGAGGAKKKQKKKR